MVTALEVPWRNDKQKSAITESWCDTVEFVRLAAATDFNNKPGALETRVFGYDVHDREGAGNFINNLRKDSHELRGYLPNHRVEAKQVNCSSKTTSGEIGGYAFSYSDKLEENTIVMCDPFFQEGQPLFQPLIKELRGKKTYQKDLNQMMGKLELCSIK
ncbi:hypothetical protein ACHAQD_012138 [Fusarium lateritium]